MNTIWYPLSTFFIYYLLEEVGKASLYKKKNEYTITQKERLEIMNGENKNEK